MAVRLSALHTGRALLPRNIILLLLSELQGLVWLESLGKLKIENFIHLIGSGAHETSSL
jgi:hypothetical protein